MPSAGITERNLAKISAQSGAREFHVYAPKTSEGCIKYRNPRVFMGGELRPPEYTLSVTDPNRIRTFVSAIR